MTSSTRRWLTLGVGLLVITVALLAYGVGWARQKLRHGMALNFLPAVVAATQPAVPFDGHIDLVRGGTFRLIAIGTNDPNAEKWWTPDGAPTTQPKHAQERRELPTLVGPAGRVRVIAWTVEERSQSDRNVSPDIDVPGAVVKTSGTDDADFDFKTSLYTTLKRMVFQKADDAATFLVRGSIDDHQWQTFAVLKPGGPQQVGPITAEIGQTTGGLASLTLKGDWAWPTRVVFVTHAGEASEADGLVEFRTPLGRNRTASSTVFRASDVATAYVQLCGQQRFEIKDLPAAQLPTTRPAGLVIEHLHPAVPGMTPIAAGPPPSIPAGRYFELLSAATQPAPPQTRSATTRP